jgi:hypothetical protein
MARMKIIKILPIGIAPLILMSYGWYLGQLHQSGPDIAGILLFFTGAVGLILGITFSLFTQKFSWHEKWVVNVQTRLAGCGIVIMLILVYARLHG